MKSIALFRKELFGLEEERDFRIYLLADGDRHLLPQVNPPHK